MIQTTTTAPPVLWKLLAHELRWQLVTLLAQSDYRVQELANRLARPMNLVSYHLRQLREAGLVHEQRSSADGRDFYCTLDVGELTRRFQHSGAQLHPALAAPAPPTPQPTRVIFLCTRNSARSQMAEGLLRAQRGQRPLEVASAGDQPATVHPAAVTALAQMGIDIHAQTSKHLDQFQGQSFDYVVTVCDQVRERCPVFPGEPNAIHWSINDPVAAAGTDAEAVVFQQTAAQLAVRVQTFLQQIDTHYAAKPAFGRG